MGCGADGRQLIYLPIPNKYAQHINKISHLSPSTRTQAGSNSRWHSTEAASADGEWPAARGKSSGSCCCLLPGSDSTPSLAQLSASQGRPRTFCFPLRQAGPDQTVLGSGECLHWSDCYCCDQIHFDSHSRSYSSVSWPHWF